MAELSTLYILIINCKAARNIDLAFYFIITNKLLQLRKIMYVRVLYQCYLLTILVRHLDSYGTLCDSSHSALLKSIKQFIQLLTIAYLHNAYLPSHLKAFLQETMTFLLPQSTNNNAINCYS